MQGRLDVGITGSMVYRQVPDFCRAFRAERPLVEVCLHEMSTREQLQAIASGDRKSTRLNSSHLVISYAVFCLKKKNKQDEHHTFGHLRKRPHRLSVPLRETPVLLLLGDHPDDKHHLSHDAA